MYLVWSREYGMWWKSSKWGYTPDVDKAGKFSLEDATEIAAVANRYIGEQEQEEYIVPWEAIASAVVSSAKNHKDKSDHV